MLFNSIEFLIFFPIVCLFYYRLPTQWRTVYLLACSYFFYMCWNPIYAVLLFLSTLLTWGSGILIAVSGRKRLWVALSFISNLSILSWFKYYSFLARSINAVISAIHLPARIPPMDIVLPVGISFYTFQALSYTVDVYRGETRAEKNFLKYALFVSFFPQLVAGPIERSKNLLNQFDEEHRPEADRIRSGLLLMLYGYFQKVVLSSYLALIVDTVFAESSDRGGFHLLIAAICFAFQIYCDFGGYSNIAIGAARVLGFRLMNNFRAPYFATSVADFWRRWHISLTTWFRDYLYIPLGGNRKGRMRKWLNCMIVFLVSGLWHGASWHFVVWGGINGVFQVAGEFRLSVRRQLEKHWKTTLSVDLPRPVKVLITFFLIDIAWVFFRASSFRDSLMILGRIADVGAAGWIHPGFIENLQELNLSVPKLIVLLFSLFILFLADWFSEQGKPVGEFIFRQRLPLRWLFYYAAIFYILIFGIYGPEYDAAQFIYFQF